MVGEAAVRHRTEKRKGAGSRSLVLIENLEHWSQWFSCAR